MSERLPQWHLDIFDVLLLVALAGILLVFQFRVAGTVAANKTISAAAFSPNGNVLFISRDEGDALFDVPSGRVRHRIAGHASAASFSPDGKILTTGDFDGKVALWDVDSGLRTRDLGRHGGRIAAVCFTPEGDMLASSGYHGTVRIWSVATGAMLRSLRPGHRSAHGLAFLIGGKLLATGSGGDGVLLWDVGTGELAARLTGPRDCFIKRLAVANDGNTLAVGLSTGVVEMWDVSNRGMIGLLAPMGSADLAFADNAGLLAGGHHGGALVWDLHEMTRCAELGGHGGVVRAVVFVGAEKRVITAGEDGSVLYWDLETGEPVRRTNGVYLRAGPVRWSVLAGFAAWLACWFVVNARWCQAHDEPFRDHLFGVCMVAGLAAGFVANGLAMAVVADREYVLADPLPLFGSLAFVAVVAQVIGGASFYRFLRGQHRERFAVAIATLAIPGAMLLIDVFYWVGVASSV